MAKPRTAKFTFSLKLGSFEDSTLQLRWKQSVLLREALSPDGAVEQRLLPLQHPTDSSQSKAPRSQGSAGTRPCVCPGCTGEGWGWLQPSAKQREHLFSPT